MNRDVRQPRLVSLADEWTLQASIADEWKHLATTSDQSHRWVETSGLYVRPALQLSWHFWISGLWSTSQSGYELSGPTCRPAELQTCWFWILKHWNFKIFETLLFLYFIWYRWLHTEGSHMEHYLKWNIRGTFVAILIESMKIGSSSPAFKSHSISKRQIRKKQKEGNNKPCNINYYFEL